MTQQTLLSTMQFKVYAILEAYQDPDNELVFRVDSTRDRLESCTMFATVLDAKGEELLSVYYTLKSGSPDVSILDIQPIKSASKQKTTWLAGKEFPHTAIDLGYKAIKWLFKQIRSDANKRGYPVDRWVSGTRTTGAYGKTANAGGRPLKPRNAKGRLESVSFDITPKRAQMVIQLLLTD